MTSRKSATDVLERELANFRGELTVADASTRSGLPLGAAEDALRALTAVYGGHLDARRRLGGGYRVRARIPLDPA